MPCHHRNKNNKNVLSIGTATAAVDGRKTAAEEQLGGLTTTLMVPYQKQGHNGHSNTTTI